MHIHHLVIFRCVTYNLLLILFLIYDFTLHPLTEDGPLSQLAEQVWEAFSHGLSSDEGPQVIGATLGALPAVVPALSSSHLQQAAQKLTALLLDSSSSSSSPSLRWVWKCS